MAKEYIERVTLKEVLTRYLNAPHVQMRNSISQGMRIAIETCIELLDNMKAADVVKVVRCAECKHCAVASWGERYCARSKYVELNELRDDDFCSYGERRDNNAD